MTLQLQKKLRDYVSKMSLEDMFTNPLAFGMTTASELQRGICRIADGSPVTNTETLRRALGLESTHSLPIGQPREVAILSGIRSGKSLYASCAAVHQALTCDLSHLGPGEIPRVSIVSLTKDLAQVVFSHLVGRISASPLLRGFQVGRVGADTVRLRHPTGREVEIKVVAGSRAGASLVARWSAGCIFDEFPRMVGGSEGVVNWDDSRDAVLLRLLPGCQLIHIGSPWAPFGPAYTMFATHFGKPTTNLVVIKAPSPDMNPVYWTEERLIEARKEPDVYRTDVLAEFSTPEEALIPVEAVTYAASNPTSPERNPTATYSAAMDPATRGNGWTFCIGMRDGNTRSIVLAKEWIGTRAEPLSPRIVLAEISNICRMYNISYVDTDQYMGDALSDLARSTGLTTSQVNLTDKERTHRYISLRTMFLEGNVRLPNNETLKSDLMRIKKRVTAQGATIVLPLTSDGRHCDYAPSVMLLLGRYLKDIEVPQESDEESLMIQFAESQYEGRNPFDGI